MAMIVLETIHKDLQIQKNLEVVANTAEIEADNKLNETEEYKARKPREYTRIKIDREDRDEILRKGKRLKKFIQKYYHKGAFFQDDLHNTTTLLVVMEFSTVIFVLQLVRTRSIKLFYPNLCKSSILVEVEEQNGIM
uniref:Uncharacterized protein n=1 Tax=Lactuca sativa TaxID=4236 RepID=A0A9R1W4C4_LACSA|nr:hypothetical protein LSAT_V11C300144050 [Lactuca sativa]